MVFDGDSSCFPYAEWRPFLQWNDYLDPLSMFCPFPIHTALLRRRMIERMGLFQARLKNRCEDWALWLHCMLNGAVFSYSPTMAALYRQHQHSVSSNVWQGEAREADMIRLVTEKFRQTGVIDERRSKVLSCGIRFVAIRSLLLGKKEVYRTLLDLSEEIVPENKTRPEWLFWSACKGNDAPILYLLLSKEFCDLSAFHLGFYSFLHAGDIRLLRKQAFKKGLAGILREIIDVIERVASDFESDFKRNDGPGVSITMDIALFDSKFLQSLEQHVPKKVSYMGYLIHQLGLLYQESGRLQEAEARFEQAIDLNPYFWRFHEDYARALEEAGQRAKRQEVVRRVVGIYGNCSFAHFYLGKECLRQFKMIDGLNHMKLSLTSDPLTWARCIMGRRLYLLILNYFRSGKQIFSFHW